MSASAAATDGALTAVGCDPVGSATRGRYPPPRLSRFSVGWRYGLAITNYVLGATLLVLLVMRPTLLGESEPPFPLPPALLVIDLALGIVALVIIRLRRRYPLLVACVTSAMMLVSQTSGVVAAWALVSVSTHRRVRDVVAGAVTYAACLLGSLAIWASFDLSIRTVLLVTVLLVFLSTAVYVAIGLFVGARRDLIAGMKDRAETAEREQELRVLQGQAVERNRIAREMHDVLAHRMSLVSMHAGALAYRKDLSPEQTREIAQIIQENAHASLTELRGVLGSLRESSAVSPTIEKPQPQALNVEDLVAEVRAGGAAIDFTNEVEHQDLLPNATVRHGYRIVQEALTNARKHAPGRRVELRLSGAPGDGLTIVARNGCSNGATPVPGSGLGLVGLRERVDLTGGRLAVRRTPGHFALEVWLPW